MACSPMRNTPYDAQEARVAQWIVDRTGIGAGDDPIGFMLVSYDLKIAEMAEMRSKLASLEAILALSSKTCGRNNCNCPGSKQVKDLVNAHMERFTQ